MQGIWVFEVANDGGGEADHLQLHLKRQLLHIYYPKNLQVLALRQDLINGVLIDLALHLAANVHQHELFEAILDYG